MSYLADHANQYLVFVDPTILGMALGTDIANELSQGDLAGFQEIRQNLFRLADDLTLTRFRVPTL